MTVALPRDLLLLSPGSSVHQYFEESLNHKEEIYSPPDCEGEVEIVVMREHLSNVSRLPLERLPQSIISFSALGDTKKTLGQQLAGAVRRRCLKAPGMRWKTEEAAREPTARPIMPVISRG